jgi:PAS domain-containing protein
LASAFDNPAILRGLADKFPFGFYVVDPERTILYWNEAAERITGYRAQEVVGRCCADDLLVHCGPQGTPLCATGSCMLRAGGLGEHQIAQVRGYADQSLRNKNDPDDPANRRISVIVRYLEGDAPQPVPEKPSADKPVTGEKN